MRPSDLEMIETIQNQQMQENDQDHLQNYIQDMPFTQLMMGYEPSPQKIAEFVAKSKPSNSIYEKDKGRPHKAGSTHDI